MTAATRTRTSAAAGGLCVVTINRFLSLAMPVDKGLALVKLISGTIEVERDFSASIGPIQFSPRGSETHAELVTISGDQIVGSAPAAKAAAGVLPRRLK